MPESPCDGRSAGAILTGPSAPGRLRVSPQTVDVRGPGASAGRAADPPSPSVARCSRPRSVASIRWPIRLMFTLDRDFIDRMDAKQVWRAALGELQVSLSPASCETWLRDTQLVDVDEQRFRIGVYSVHVECTIVPAEPAVDGEDPTAGPGVPAPQVRLEPGRVGGEGSSA